MRKKPSIPNLRKKAWTIFSKVIRQMYSDHRSMVTCVTCGKTLSWQESHAGHFIPRARGITCYFECRNVHPQCPGCNYFGGEIVKIRYTQWMIQTYGQDEVERLLALSKTTRKVTRSDYEELIDHLKLCEAEL